MQPDDPRPAILHVITHPSPEQAAATRTTNTLLTVIALPQLLTILAIVIIPIILCGLAVIGKVAGPGPEPHYVPPANPYRHGPRFTPVPVPGF